MSHMNKIKPLLLLPKTVAVSLGSVYIPSGMELLKGISRKGFTAIIRLEHTGELRARDVAYIEAIYRKMVRSCGHTFSQKQLYLVAPQTLSAHKLLRVYFWDVFELKEDTIAHFNRKLNG